MQVIAFFNNRIGTGTTTLVYHLSWMFAEMGQTVLAADLDPQSTLSRMLLDDEELEHIGPHGWLSADSGAAAIGTNLYLQWGNIELSDFDEVGIKPANAIRQAIDVAAARREADLVLVDLGPNLGALNRSALIAADHVVVPLAPDFHSLQALRILGPRLRNWRNEGQHPQPVGFVLLQPSARSSQQHWIANIPTAYHEATGEDPHCLANLRFYRGLMPMAQQARKPMFRLKPADGAFGANALAVLDCHAEFKSLAQAILDAINQNQKPGPAV